MRKKLIAGNWKMHLLPVGARALIERVRAEIDRDAATLANDRDVMVAPPDILIPAVAQALAGSSVLLGAQNMHFEEKGAFTGEVSPPMLQAYGVTHVILGHSERRHIFHETDELINRKVLAALHRFCASAKPRRNTTAAARSTSCSASSSADSKTSATSM
jgi:triosephosphate isomerase